VRAGVLFFEAAVCLECEEVIARDSRRGVGRLEVAAEQGLPELWLISRPSGTIEVTFESALYVVEHAVAFVDLLNVFLEVRLFARASRPVHARLIRDYFAAFFIMLCNLCRTRRLAKPLSAELSFSQQLLCIPNQPVQLILKSRSRSE
jgi:hypothetical protein